MSGSRLSAGRSALSISNRRRVRVADHQKRTDAMRRRRRLLLWSLVALATIVAVNAGAFYFRMIVPWTVMLDRSPGSCRVYQRMPRRDVRLACGPPTAIGYPRFSGSGDFFEFQLPTKCAAPCEAIGNRVVFYDCHDRVALVRRPGEDWCAVDGHPLNETSSNGAEQGAAPDSQR
jgi:hypothetical protein